MPSHDDYTEAYAECYEFITQHKNYAEEVDILIDFLEKHEFIQLYIRLTVLCD